MMKSDRLEPKRSNRKVEKVKSMARDFFLAHDAAELDEIYSHKVLSGQRKSAFFSWIKCMCHRDVKLTSLEELKSRTVRFSILIITTIIIIITKKFIFIDDIAKCNLRDVQKPQIKHTELLYTAHQHKTNEIAEWKSFLSCKQPSPRNRTWALKWRVKISLVEIEKWSQSNSNAQIEPTTTS